jgi:cytochrome c oxidase subunit II
MSSTSDDNPDAENAALLAERRWATLSIFIVCLLILIAAFAGIHQLIMPQARVETVNVRTVPLRGEFIESNLGSAVEPDGSVTVRMVAQQYSFTPPCLLVPADTPITIRATSIDAIHGLIIDGTNINTMLVPGFISVAKTRFRETGDRRMPCQEYCGVGHEGMWANVRVIPRDQFIRMAADKPRLSCVE